MALVKCPECGKRKVSSTAESCPKCGFAIREYFEKQESETKERPADTAVSEPSSDKADKKPKKREKKQIKLPSFFKKFFNKKVLICVIVLAAIGGAAFVAIHDLTAKCVFYSDKHGILMESGSDIIFSAEYNRKPYLFGGFDLYCDGAKVGKMVDNGKDGDMVANDGVYSLKKHLDGQEKPYEFYAKNTLKTTKVIQIHSFDKLVEDDYKDYLEYNDAISEINLKYISDEGYMPHAYAKTALTEVYDIAKEYMEKGTILTADMSSDSVSVQFSSGIISTYTPSIRDMKSGGVEMKIRGIHPFNSNVCKNFRMIPRNKLEQINYDIGQKLADLDEFFPWNRGKVHPDNFYLSPDGSISAGKSLDKQFDNISYLNDINGTEVNPFTLSMIGSNEIIIWDGHGKYNSMTDCEELMAFSDLGTSYKELTAEELTKKMDKTFSDTYEDFIREGSIQIDGIYEDYDEKKDLFYLWHYYVTYGFTPAYIYNSNLDFENSIIFLSACHSGHTYAFLDAFASKGAQCVVGFPITVSVGYSDTLLSSFFDYMGRIDPKTDECYTVEDALFKAIDDLGPYKNPGDEEDTTNYWPVYMLNPKDPSFKLGDVPEHMNFSNMSDKVRDYVSKKDGETEEGYFDGVYRHYYNHKSFLDTHDYDNSEIKELNFSGSRVQITTFNGTVMTGSYRVFDDRELSITFDDPSLVEYNPDTIAFKLADDGETLFLYDEYFSEGIYELVKD